MRDLKLIFLVVVLLGLSGAMALRGLLISDDARDSSLSADTTTHDFGKVGRIDLQHTFLLTNRCKVPVQILYSTSGCGCTTAHVPAKRLEIGDTVAVGCSVDTTGRRGKLYTHVSVAYKELSGTSTKVHITTFFLTGVILGPVDVQPEELSFLVEQSETKILRIHAADLSAVFATASSDHEAIRVKVIESGRAVSVSFNANAWHIPPGTTWILLKTSLTTEGVLRIPVRLTRTSVDSIPNS